MTRALASPRLAGWASAALISSLAFTLCSTFAQSRSTAPQKKDEVVEQEIIAREKASFVAWQQKDKAFYASYWGDEMTEFLPDNPHLTSKREEMPVFEHLVTAWRLDSIEMIHPDVRVYGDVALLTYEEAVSGASDGKPVRYRGKVTMVYVKRNGQWQGIHYHESKD